MPLFKTKYNDVEKAIKAISSEEDYDISKANDKLFENKQFLLVALKSKIGTSVLNKTGDWIYKDSDIMISVIRRDKRYEDRIFDKVSEDVKNAIEDAFLDRIEPIDQKILQIMEENRSVNTTFTFSNVLVNGADRETWYYYKKDIGHFNDGRNQYEITNLINRAIDYQSALKKGFMFLPKSKLFIANWDGNSRFSRKIIATPIEKLLNNNALYAASFISAGMPSLMTERKIWTPERINALDVDKWLQVKHEVPKLDNDFVRKTIIPCVDNLLSGKRVLISTQQDKEDLIPYIIQNALFSIPIDKANSFSFCTVPCVHKMRMDFQISGTTELEKFKRIPHDVFVIDAEKGLQKYEPQTEYAKQMLAKLNQSENVATSKPIEQPQVKHTNDDHELS